MRRNKSLKEVNLLTFYQVNYPQREVRSVAAVSFDPPASFTKN
jgi:hypothetical protein